MNMEFDLVISEPDYGMPTYLDEFQNEILTLDEFYGLNAILYGGNELNSISENQIEESDKVLPFNLTENNVVATPELAKELNLIGENQFEASLHLNSVTTADNLNSSSGLLGSFENFFSLDCNSSWYTNEENNDSFSFSLNDIDSTTPDINSVTPLQENKIIITSEEKKTFISDLDSNSSWYTNKENNESLSFSVNDFNATTPPQEEKNIISTEEKPIETTCASNLLLPAIISTNTLRLKEIKEKRKNKTCKFLGCNNVERARGFCRKHDTKNRCGADGCTKNPRKGGFCIRHGGGKRCTSNGCSRGAQGVSNLCKKHGGGGRCEVEGCHKSSQGNKRCRAHGDKFSYCSMDTCKSIAQLAGVCRKHYLVLNEQDKNHEMNDDDEYLRQHESFYNSKFSLEGDLEWISRSY